MPTFGFDNSFARELTDFYVPVTAESASEPELLKLNHDLARHLGLDPDVLDSVEGARIFAGTSLPEGAQPLSQAYAGHQFGSFVPQLGDGRALLLGEVIDRDGERRDLQLKGSGKTPFSRGGDGRSALGPVLREYLVSEAMFRLGIPSTRALAVVATGDRVIREQVLPGGVLTRVAASHVRVGTFQFFAVRGMNEHVRRLADYCIARHYPELTDSQDRYLDFLAAVRDAQAGLIAQWMLVGFVHGVMNTDNMTISGETIDYGPCAFLDRYDPNTVFSSIDVHGRYAFGRQPSIGQWNLGRLAETLLPLIDSDSGRAVELAQECLGVYADRFTGVWLEGMRAKLGLASADADDFDLANDFLAALKQQNADYTLAFRRLSNAVAGDDQPLRRLLEDPSGLDPWLERWRTRLASEELDAEERFRAMDRVNPVYIPRNHRVEEALAAAVDNEDLGPFEALVAVLEKPFDERTGLDSYAEPAPAGFGSYRTFCGT